MAVCTPVAPYFVALFITLQGLAPTLIIVRVADGKSVDSVGQMMSIHFAEQASEHAGATIELRATVNAPSYRQDVVLEDRDDTGNHEAKIHEARAV